VTPKPAVGQGDTNPEIKFDVALTTPAFDVSFNIAGSTPSINALNYFDLASAGLNSSGQLINPWSKNLTSSDAASALLPYALLSDAIYNNRSEVEGWKRVGTWQEIIKGSFVGLSSDEVDGILLKIQNSGFNASVYEKNGQHVLSFEGSSLSNFGVDFIGNNIPQAVSGLRTGNQYEFALSLTLLVLKKFGHDNLVLTGHSLGGGLAQYSASELHLKAVTFNGAGVKSPLYTNSSNIINVRVAGDPVSSGVFSTENLGGIKYEYKSYNGNSLTPLTNHKLPNLIDSLVYAWHGN
jgi:hypothetical protein